MTLSDGLRYPHLTAGAALGTQSTGLEKSGRQLWPSEVDIMKGNDQPPSRGPLTSLRGPHASVASKLASARVWALRTCGGPPGSSYMPPCPPTAQGLHCHCTPALWAAALQPATSKFETHTPHTSTVRREVSHSFFLVPLLKTVISKCLPPKVFMKIKQSSASKTHKMVRGTY